MEKTNLLFLNLECICKISVSLSTNEVNMGSGAKVIVVVKAKKNCIIGCTCIGARASRINGKMPRQIDIIVIVMLGVQQS
jgi:hypothetical protein